MQKALRRSLSLALALALAPARSQCASLLPLDGRDWRLTRRCCGPVVVVPNATVPGGVWDNLHRAGKIGDPLYRDNDVVFAANTTMPVGTRWSFAKEFAVPAGVFVAAAAGDGMVLLELAGVQTLANVTLNGRLLLRTDNMFRLFRIVVPAGLLKPGPGTNLLEIELSTTSLIPGGGPPGFTNAPYIRDESDAWVSPLARPPRCCRWPAFRIDLPQPRTDPRCSPSHGMFLRGRRLRPLP